MNTAQAGLLFIKMWNELTIISNPQTHDQGYQIIKDSLDVLWKDLNVGLVETQQNTDQAFQYYMKAQESSAIELELDMPDHFLLATRKIAEGLCRIELEDSIAELSVRSNAIIITTAINARIELCRELGLTKL